MEYGDTNIKPEKLYLYQGFDPATVNFPPHNRLETQMEVVNQRDAELFFMWQMYQRSEHQPDKKRDILKQITETAKHRNHLDGSMELIEVLLYGPGKGSSILESVSEPGLPLVDDWACLKSMSYIDKLVREAYTKWHNLEEVDGVLNDNIALVKEPYSYPFWTNVYLDDEGKLI